MKILGNFSGKLYEVDERENMKECGTILFDSKESDEEFIANHHIEDLKKCIICMGCPLAQKSVV